VPIELPNLDDRTYADLVNEARTLIPTHAPEWTNHNSSDPGITLIELFAYLTEMMIYRLNRVTDQNMLAFLKLLNGNPQWEPSPGESLTEAVKNTVLALRKPCRAETSSRMTRQIGGTDEPGHVSVIIVPFRTGTEKLPQPIDDLRQKVFAFLDKRRLITTIIHVAKPAYFSFTVQLTIVLMPDTIALDQAAILDDIKKVLQDFFDPLTGGDERTGWPFGRNVYVSEIYNLLDVQPGVDYITKTVDPQTMKELPELSVAKADSDRLILNAQGKVVGLEIKAEELVDAQLNIVLPPSA
jgi:hypothetical protein